MVVAAAAAGGDCMCVLAMLRIDEIFQKESDPFTTNEGMLEVINTIRFRHFDKAVEVSKPGAGRAHLLWRKRLVRGSVSRLN